MLGNLDAKRDWGYAPEYVEGMFRILQHDKPEDFVLATGNSHSVRQFLELCFEYLDMNCEDYVEIDQRYFRPTEVDYLLGDGSKAERLLDWKPQVDIKTLAKRMVDTDLLHQGVTPPGEGIEYLKQSPYSWTENKLTVG